MTREAGARHPIVAGWRGPDSAGALQIAAVLARAVRAPIELTAAYPYEPAAWTSRIPPSSRNEARMAAAHDRVRRARALVPPDVEVHERIAPTLDVAEAIEDVARAVGACAIAVGRDVDGHTTRSLFPHAPCPVAVSPVAVALPGDQPLRRIGVADDGSPAAALAVTAAERLARATDARLTRHTVSPDDGDPGPRLVEASAGLDLLVCGSHGRGRLLSAALGSVSARLVAEARCAVLVIPPEVAAWDAGPLGLSVAG